MTWKSRGGAIGERNETHEDLSLSRNGGWETRPGTRPGSVSITCHCVSSVSLRPPAHWFFTVEEPTRSSPPRTAVHRSSFLSRSQPPLPYTLSLSSPITPLFLLPPCPTHGAIPSLSLSLSLSLSFSLVRSASVSLRPRDSLASSCSMASSPSRFRQNGTHARGAAVVKATALHGMLLTYTLYHSMSFTCSWSFLSTACQSTCRRHFAMPAINNLGQVKRAGCIRGSMFLKQVWARVRVTLARGSRT